VSAPTLLLPQEIGADWISPSQTRNFIKGDPLLDWLDYYGTRLDEATGEWEQKQDFFHGYWPDTKDPNYIAEADFSKFIIEKGKKFEEAVISLLGRELPIARIAYLRQDIYDQHSPMRTLEKMNEGVPLIYQPVLWDSDLKVYGSPDLLVRADHLNKIIPGSIAEGDARIKAPNLSGDWHYVVLDIKYTSLEFNAAGEIANNKEHYKVQVALYTAALAKLQGYQPQHGYLIGRTWKDHKKNRGDSCLDRIGGFSIDQPQHNKPNINWIEAAKPACEWIRRMRTEGHAWTVHSALEIKELRPDMGNTQDAPYHLAKKQIAQETGEITQLWSVGCAKRDAFIEEHKSSDWKIPECTVEKLKISGASAARLEKILWINKEAPTNIWPPRIDWSREEWAAAQPVEFFVDFETCNDLDDDFTNLPKKGGQALIFMIGCGHIENGEWKFECFTANDCTPESELQIIRQWMAHMDDVRKRLAKPPSTTKQPSLFDEATEKETISPRVYHWSPAEKSTLIEAYDSAQARHGDAVARPNFYDFLNRVVRPSGTTDCVAVRGAFNFGLKSIGKALHALGYIQTKWDDGPTDGLGAMTGAWWCYRQAAQQGIPVAEVQTVDGRKLFQEIIRYNEIDCRVMYEAIDYLRQHH